MADSVTQARSAEGRLRTRTQGSGRRPSDNKDQLSKTPHRPSPVQTEQRFRPRPLLFSRHASNASFINKMAPMEGVFTEQAPKPLPQFSQAVKYNGMVYCSGNVGLDPATSKVVDGTVKDRTV
jgi:hypothetical protein